MRYLLMSLPACCYLTRREKVQSRNSWLATFPLAAPAMHLGVGPDRKPVEVTKSGGSNGVGTPLHSKFKQKIRPMLDIVDKLRDLGVMEEGIALPTIVVVGDQSSGKSSVLESLAGISLPRGQGIATRVPLILRLQASAEEAITVEYEGTKEDIREEGIEKAVVKAQNKLAGESKGISNKPISLHIRKADAPDLTMVDLPGITRVPVHGQPDNIYEQIADIIRHYISSPESVILNVLSATVDFPTCESIRMSQQADKTGDRTLAVVTKVDKSPEGLLEKVTTDAVHIGLGYICVRNRVADAETHQEARAIEKELFSTHLLLSKLDKRIVGIPALADRLTQIQVDSIRRCLPKLIDQIEKQLSANRTELATLPAGVQNPSEAYMVFSKTMTSRTDTVKQLIVSGDFQQYPDDSNMHYTARLDEMFTEFAEYLAKSGVSMMRKERTEEIMTMMSESKGVNLPNFLPTQVFINLIRKQVDKVAAKCVELVEKAHQFAEGVHSQVIKKCTEGYPCLMSASTMGARNVIGESRIRCTDFVERMLTKEQEVIFTKNGLYMEIVKAVQASVESAKAATKNSSSDHSPYGAVPARTEGKLFEELIGPINVNEVVRNASTDYQTAWDMKVTTAAYWAVVQKRIADIVPQEVKFSLQQAMVTGVEYHLLSQTSSPGFSFESMMEEDSVLAQRRRRLTHSITVLRSALGMVSESLDNAPSSLEKLVI